MNFTIRTAGREDAVLIADISHQTFYETFAAQNSKEDMDIFLNEQFTKGKLMLEVGARENIFLLAYAEDQIAGYVKLRDARVPLALKNNKALEIARIYSMNHLIGKGVGSALMKASLSMATRLEKDVVWLGVWAKNIRAIDFYKRWGFEKFDETDFLLGNDLQKDWLMKKHLQV
jgi:ribosomal protein S18 acetylase RimI-like enzyme